MTFTFLHSSDWHIGKPFGRFPSETATILRRSRLMAIDRLAAVAREGGAAHILVAGDVFDRPGIADRDLHAPLEQMRAHSAIAWHIIPGNHDPAVTGGAWDRARRKGLPANLHLHLESRPIEIAPEVWLLPSPLASKAMSRDPTAWMDAAETPSGSHRIGLAHGSIQGFGGDQAASIEIAPDRARRARLDYLALGDWHGFLQVGSATAYSGTPEPDSFLDNAAGCALLVTLRGPAGPVRIERRDTGQHRWHQRILEASRPTDLSNLEAEVESWGAAAGGALVVVEARGPATAAEERAIRALLDKIDPRILHLERKLDALKLIAGEDDLAELGEGSLRAIGEELSQMASGDNASEAEVAARALRHLFDLAGQLPADRDEVAA